ncbi:flagellar motor switch protein FliM [Escherichia coli]
MGDSILSQAEIDALLNGDSEVKDEPTASVSGESDIRPYDPNTQRRVVRERLQALEIINERFARHFRMGLFNLLRRSPDITVGAIRIQPYHEFARNLPVPTNLNLIHLKPLRGTGLVVIHLKPLRGTGLVVIHLKPLRGTGLVVFSPSLVFIAVDNLFGGDGRFPTKVEGREFTHTEQRVINRMLKLALEGYSDAWKAINPLEVEYVRSEMQVKFTNITTSPNDIVVNTPFHVEIGNLTGEFNICLPFSMIEPLRELLVNPPLENSRNEDQNWRDNLVRQVQHSQLELVANFADISLRLSQILKLKPGDVLPIEKPDRIIAHVDGVPVLTSQYGTLNGQYALRIEHLINPILNSLNEEQPK